MADIKQRSDSHTRTTFVRDASYGERVSRSCGGIIFGWILVAAAGFLLYWNEGRAVVQYNTLQEGLALCEPLGYLTGDSPAVDKTLAHFSGQLLPARVEDQEFGVVVDAVTLTRKVEMYQWHEKQDRREYKENGGTRVETTYSYYTAWSGERIDSSRFDDPQGHENPGSSRYSSATFESPSVRVAGYALSNTLRAAIGGWEGIQAAKPMEGLQLVGGTYYSGQPNTPRVGDVRINFQFKGKKGTEVSVIGQLRHGAVSSYYAKAGNSIELLTTGVVSADDMFSSEMTANTVLTWALRFAGWLMMVVGFSLTTDILYTLVDWLPIVRNVVSMSLFVVNMSLGTSTSFVIIAIGWIRFRPMLAFALLAAAGGLVFFLLRGKGSSSEKKERRD